MSSYLWAGVLIACGICVAFMLGVWLGAALVIRHLVPDSWLRSRRARRGR